MRPIGHVQYSNVTMYINHKISFDWIRFAVWIWCRCEKWKRIFPTKIEWKSKCELKIAKDGGGEKDRKIHSSKFVPHIKCEVFLLRMLLARDVCSIRFIISNAEQKKNNIETHVESKSIRNLSTTFLSCRVSLIMIISGGAMCIQNIRHRKQLFSLCHSHKSWVGKSGWHAMKSKPCTIRNVEWTTTEGLSMGTYLLKHVYMYT